MKVHAAALNPVDYKKPSITPLPSWTLGNKPIGQDFSGVVVGTSGGTTTPFKEGDAVFGTTHYCLAEYLICKCTDAALKPASLTHAQAASLVTIAQTGLQALRKVPSLKEGGRVLVIGASGGCGLAGVQLARAQVGPSGKVIGVCSGASAPLVQSLGVTDALLDYTNTAGFMEGLKEWGPFDIVYDTVSSWEATDTLGGTPYAQAVTPHLASGVGAKVVAINGTTRQWVGALLGWSGSSTYELFMQEPSQGDLGTTVDLVEKGALKPVIDSQHPFTQAGCEAAYARLKSRRAQGKVVVDVVAAPQ